MTRGGGNLGWLAGRAFEPAAQFSPPPALYPACAVQGLGAVWDGGLAMMPNASLCRSADDTPVVARRTDRSVARAP